MKKIYSFVLMATMLLVGTNAWAAAVPVNDKADFADTWATAVNGATVEIQLNADITDLATTMWLGTAEMNSTPSTIIVDLNGHNLTTSAKYGFVLTHGVLKFINNNPEAEGKGIVSHTGSAEAIYVTGSTNKDCVPSEENVNYFSHLVIGENVTLSHTGGYAATISIDDIYSDNGAPARTYVNYNTNVYADVASNQNKGVANGVRIDVWGKILGVRYGIKTNGYLGNVKYFKEVRCGNQPIPAGGAEPKHTTGLPSGYKIMADDDQYAVFTYVHDGARIEVSDAPPTSGDKVPVGIYAAGYGKWKIEGYVEGANGVIVKSGDVAIVGAEVKATGTYHEAEHTTAGNFSSGNAITLITDNSWAGEINVTISEGTKASATSGYALLEDVVQTTGTGTEVQSITVNGGTFTGGSDQNAGTIKISETTAVAASGSNPSAEIQVTSAVLNGEVTIGQGTHTLDEFTSGSAIIDGATAGQDIVVPLTIKPNVDGYASYSAPVNLILPSGLAAYVGEFANDVLTLNDVSYVKQNQGVILKGTYGETYQLVYDPASLSPASTDAAKYESNDLKPSTAWAGQSDKDHIYCLRRADGATQLYRYIGAEMPANKAYLDLSNHSGYAPQRIRMVIAQEEQTEAIESVEAASVKAVKFVENGEILIRRGENVYNLQGQIVK